MLQNAEPLQVVSHPPVPSPVRADRPSEGAVRNVGDIIAASALFAFLLWLRLLCAEHYRIDSDEPQHLHVIWGWAHGMLQYRDIFDNHSPLFQMLCTPLFRLLGERADIVIPMRYAMLPLFAFDLWCVYKIAERLGTKRMALWTTLATGFSTVFFEVSTEFRTDDLWVALWLLALVLVTGGEFKGWRAFWTGVVFGAAFAVSMKSALLIVSLILAGAFVFFLCRKFGDDIDPGPLTGGLGLALLGLILVPSAVVLFFASRGALHEMYYGAILHNTVLGGNKLRKLAFKRFLFPIALIAAPFIGYWVIRLRSDRAAAYRQTLILLSALFYAAALKSFWPLLTDQDYLPRDPLIILALAPAVAWLTRLSPPWTSYTTGCILLGEIIALCHDAAPWRNDTSGKIQQIGEVLRFTNPGDYVMDGKGEFIYRNRPFFYVLEGVTITRMRLGLIHDDIIRRMIETRTCVLVKGRMPKEDDKWLEENYLFDSQKVGIVGKYLDPFAASAERKGPASLEFSTFIPANYTPLSQPEHPVSGTLDGKALQKTQFIEPGKHLFAFTGKPTQFALVWSQAVERGYSMHWRPQEK